MVAKLLRKSPSRLPLGELTAMTCSSADDCFLVVTPSRCTSGGSRASTWLTRLVTLTVLRSGSEPTAKLTESA